MRPSFVTLTLYPCLFPSSFTVSSTILGFPLILLTTSCSNPEDFVNTRIDLLVAASKRCESERPAPVRAAARRNSLRLKNALIDSLSRARPDARSPENFRIHILRSSPALASPLPTNNTPRGSTRRPIFRGRVTFYGPGVCRPHASLVQQRVPLTLIKHRESLSESLLRFRIKRFKRLREFLLVFSRVHAQQQINEAIHLRLD